MLRHKMQTKLRRLLSLFVLSLDSTAGKLAFLVEWLFMKFEIMIFRFLAELCASGDTAGIRPWLVLYFH